MATLVIWHGYLLGGTGSNIYSASIVEAWVRARHHVVLMCQDPDPSRHPQLHSYERVDGTRVIEQRELTPGGAAARLARGEGACTMVQADIAGLLPVYLLDRYAGFEVKRFVDLDQAELDRYAERYQSALEGVIERFDPAGALLNHVVMGPPALRPIFERHDVPYVVKVHGSELEYCIAEDSRFVEPARYGLAGARAILSGSGHISARTSQLLGEECLGDRVEVVPPGVDLERFHPVTTPQQRRAVHERLLHVLRGREAASGGRARAHAAALEDALAGPAAGAVGRLRTLHHTYEERDPEPGAAAEFATFDPNGTAPLVAYVGKMIRQKGVHLVVAAMPLVVQAVPDVRFAMVGFGQLREGIEALLVAIERGNRTLLDELVAHLNTLDGGPDEPLGYLQEFFDSLEQEEGGLEAYQAAAVDLRTRVTFTGQVNHQVLAELWPLCTTSIVPSVSAEAFGMVSAEAAGCGCPPIVAHHSGLADVADALDRGYPPYAKGLVSFSLAAPDPVRSLAECIVRTCTLGRERHAEVAAAARAVVEQEWSWDAISAQIAAIFDRTPANASSG